MLENCMAVEIVNGVNSPKPAKRTADFDNDGRNDLIIG
jgi:hypothetical protein